jgi:Fe-S cluster assembly protein SufD
MNLTEKIDWKHKLVAEFNEKNRASNPSHPIAQLKNEALGCFAHLSFPTTKQEEWKYTNLQKLLKIDFEFQRHSQIRQEELATHLIPQLEATRLVFVNGVFQAELSDLDALESGLEIHQIGEFMEHQPEKIKPYLIKHLNIREEIFNALNTAFLEHGIVLEVKSGKIINKPIILHYIQDARHDSIAAQPHHIVIVHENAQATLIEKYDTIGAEASFINQINEVFVGENAFFDHYRIQNESNQAFQIATTQVYQKPNSRYENITISLRGALIRNNLNILLDGSGIESNMYGLYMLDGKTHVDNHTIADHLMPNSVSNELYKGILDEQSNGVFNGKIYVRPDAQKTNAYQQNRNVLLSDTASVNTKPQLEIWADDVKCSHGATTGSLDETALFYLRSRGIPLKEAKALLVHAFGNEIIDKIKIEAIRLFLEDIILQRLGK